MVGGVALFTVLGRVSACSGCSLIELTGFAFPFTPYAVVLAQVFVVLPYLVLSVEGALRAADRRYEDAAATLGARPLPWCSGGSPCLFVGPWHSRRYGACLGQGSGGVRRDHHICRQFPGHSLGRCRSRSTARWRPIPARRWLLSVLLLAVSVSRTGLAPQPLGAAGVAGLAATVGIRRGDFRLDLELDVGDGEVVALLGPNGAGKSTALRALAGLVRIDDGRIVLGGPHPLADAASREHLPTLSAADQCRLPGRHPPFPHLSVLDNVAFGLRARGRQVGDRPSGRGSWLERIGVGELASARPRAISGGQAQRVALARAWTVDPQLLLLDEPLAALDARTRLLVRGELRRHLADFGGATLVVTHDPIDAAVLADRLVVIERGQVVQQGPPREVARHPRTDYVARLVGLNLLAGVADW